MQLTSAKLTIELLSFLIFLSVIPSLKYHNYYGFNEIEQQTALKYANIVFKINIKKITSFQLDIRLDDK